MLYALRPIAAAAGASIAVVDVDAHADLEAVWGDRVPVLFLGPPAPARELCHYHLDAARVHAALVGAAALTKARNILHSLPQEECDAGATRRP